LLRSRAFNTEHTTRSNSNITDTAVCSGKTWIKKGIAIMDEPNPVNPKTEYAINVVADAKIMSARGITELR
jgi:hypothetical protein